MSAHVLVVGGGGTLPHMLREHGDRSVRTSVICRLSTVARLSDLTEHDRIVALDRESPDSEWLDAARLVHRCDPVTAVAAFGELDQHRAAAIAADLCLPWHSPEVVASVRNKLTMRAALHRAGLDDTDFCPVDTPDDLVAFLHKCAGPIIVKPVDGTASFGVSEIGTEADAAVAWQRATSIGEWGSGLLMAERKWTGPQLSVECFGEGGRHSVVGTTLKFSHPGTFVELGHVCPADAAPEDLAAATELTRAALQALAVPFGPTHTEVVLTEHGPRILETHLRAAGDDIPLLVRDVTGVDIDRRTVAQILDEPSHYPLGQSRARSSAVWFFAVEADGVLHEVRGTGRAAALPGVVDVSVSARVGDPVHRLRSSKDRLGQVMTHGSTPGEAIQRARTAASLVEFAVLASHDPWSATV